MTKRPIEQENSECFEVRKRVVLEKLDEEYDLGAEQEDIKNDKDVAKAALKEHGDFLEELPHFCDDFDMVKIAVKSYPESLVHASERLRDNEKIVELATKGNIHAFEHATERLKSNKEFVMKMLRHGVGVLECLEVNDPVFARELIYRDPGCFEYLAASIRDDFEIAKMAMKKDPSMIIYVGDSIKDKAFEFVEELGKKRDFTNLIPEEEREFISDWIGEAFSHVEDDITDEEMLKMENDDDEYFKEEWGLAFEDMQKKFVEKFPKSQTPPQTISDFSRSIVVDLYQEHKNL